MENNQGEQTYRRGSVLGLEEAKQVFEARIESAVQEAMTIEAPELAEPEGWWNLWAIGPVQPIAPGGPLRPHKIIKVGEPAYIFTFLWLNPRLVLDGGPTVCDLISNLACDFEVKYCTGNKCTWSLGPGELNVTHKVEMIPDRCFDYDVLAFTAREDWADSCFETHICARITGCEDRGGAPPLAGFVTQVLDLDPELFAAPVQVPSRWEVDTPIQFMVYP